MLSDRGCASVASASINAARSFNQPDQPPPPRLHPGTAAPRPTGPSQPTPRFHHLPGDTYLFIHRPDLRNTPKERVPGQTCTHSIPSSSAAHKHALQAARFPLTPRGVGERFLDVKRESTMSSVITPRGEAVTETAACGSHGGFAGRHESAIFDIVDAAYTVYLLELTFCSALLLHVSRTRPCFGCQPGFVACQLGFWFTCNCSEGYTRA